MVREMVNVKTQYITRVVNILKAEYIRLYKIYRDRQIKVTYSDMYYRIIVIEQSR